MAGTPPTWSRQDGAATPFIAVGLLSFVLLLALVLDSGTMFVGVGQLQKVADSTARAAMGEIARSAPDLSGPALRDEASRVARDVAASSGVLQGGIDEQSSDLVIEFGTYNFTSETFQSLQDTFPGGTPLAFVPTAARVTARRAQGSSSGPLQLLSSTVRTADVGRTAVAALRCRNVVTVVDVSASFAEDIETVEAQLQTTLQAIEDSGLPDRVGIVAFRNRVVASVGMLDPDSPMIDSTVEDLSNLTCRVTSENPPFPPCIGTDVASALDEAGDLLRNGGANPACENLVLLLTDGDPCVFSDAVVNASVMAAPDFPVFPGPDPALDFVSPVTATAGGGSTIMQAQTSADALCNDANLQASVATIAIDTGGNDNGQRCICVEPNPINGDCQPANFFGVPVDIDLGGGDVRPLQFRTTSQNDTLLENVTCRFGQKFLANFDDEPLSEKMSRASATIPPVPVQ